MAAGMGEVDGVFRGRLIQVESRRMTAQFGVLIATADNPLASWSYIDFGAESRNQCIDCRNVRWIARNFAQP